MSELSIQIGARRVGDGAPCYIVAEIGSNHNNDLNLARRLIDAAADAGADAVKFQTFRADAHYSRHAPGFSYLGGVKTYELIKSLEIDRAWHAPLQRHAAERGVHFFSSPCDSEAIEELRALDVPAYKLASFDLSDTDLISLMARTGKPVILSTGMADWGDIQRAVATCRDQGNDSILVLQCTSLYPAPARLSNLAAMASIRSAFRVLTGYSDHTEGDHVPIAAVARGACMIEKHFTLDRKMAGPDHPFAIEPAELASMVTRIREVESAIGDGFKLGPRPEEREMFDKGRRSLHARIDIHAGTVIAADMLAVKRPGLGIPPHHKAQVVGRVAKTDIAADQWITWDLI